VRDPDLLAEGLVVHVTTTVVPTRPEADPDRVVANIVDVNAPAQVVIVVQQQITLVATRQVINKVVVAQHHLAVSRIVQPQKNKWFQLLGIRLSKIAVFTSAIFPTTSNGDISRILCDNVRSICTAIL